MQLEPPEATGADRPLDAVIFYFEENDDTLGWDYPAHRERLSQAGTQTLMLRGSSDGQLAKGELARLDAFAAALKGRYHEEEST